MLMTIGWLFIGGKNNNRVRLINWLMLAKMCNPMSWLLCFCLQSYMRGEIGVTLINMFFLLFFYSLLPLQFLSLVFGLFTERISWRRAKHCFCCFLFFFGFTKFIYCKVTACELSCRLRTRFFRNCRWRKKIWLSGKSADRTHFRCLFSLLSPFSVRRSPLALLHPTPPPFPWLYPFPIPLALSPIAIIIVLSVLPPSQIAQQQRQSSQQRHWQKNRWPI